MNAYAMLTARMASTRKAGSWLEPISRATLTEADVAWIAEAARGSYSGISVRDILQMAAQGKLLVYRICGKGTGILVAEFTAYPAGVEAVIWAVAGNNLVYSFPDILAQFSKIAIEQGCRWIGARSEDPRIIRYLEKRCGMQLRAQWVQMELGHVQ